MRVRGKYPYLVDFTNPIQHLLPAPVLPADLAFVAVAAIPAEMVKKATAL
jgi:hypothetical protein